MLLPKGKQGILTTFIPFPFHCIHNLKMELAMEKNKRSKSKDLNGYTREVTIHDSQHPRLARVFRTRTEGGIHHLARLEGLQATWYPVGWGSRMIVLVRCFDKISLDVVHKSVTCTKKYIYICMKKHHSHPSAPQILLKRTNMTKTIQNMWQILTVIMP